MTEPVFFVEKSGLSAMFEKRGEIAEAALLAFSEKVFLILFLTSILQKVLVWENFSP